MKIIRGNMHEDCVLAMGKFECIHLGHKDLIGEVTRLAKNARMPSTVMVFDPHPIAVLVDMDYKVLFTIEERAAILEGLGIDYMLVCPFNDKFAALSPAEFCDMLFDQLRAKIVVVGKEYRFGKWREGTVTVLQERAVSSGSMVYGITPNLQDSAFSDEKKKISTSAIRSLISANRLPEATQLLGFPFFVQGVVSKGRQLGRELGFRTLNLYPPKDKFLPVDGVYASQVLVNGMVYQGITNVGLRPTVSSGETVRTVETHLLDYDGGDLYGQEIRAELLYFIRPEQRFDSLEALKAQIHKDIELRNK